VYSSKDDRKRIFVFWWQGEEVAPPIVKACIDSIRKWSKGFAETVVLNKMGGIDATCFLAKPLPPHIDNYSFYSIKGVYEKSSGWKWTSFFMFSKEDDVLVDNMCRFYERYWKEHDEAITYLFLDCWITALYQHIPKIKEEIDSLPNQGTQLFNLICHINDEYTEEHFKSVLDKTFVYKLTYKEKWQPTIDGKKTIFGHIIENYE